MKKILFIICLSCCVLSGCKEYNANYYSDNIHEVELAYKNNPKNINTITSFEQSPLFYAVLKNNTDVVKFLVKNGADTKVKVDPFVVSPKKFADKHLVSMAFQYANSMLKIAALNGNKDIVEVLVQSGTDEEENAFALVLAAEGGHEDIVKYLVEHTNVSNNAKSKALAFAAYADKKNIVKYLVKNGADINQALHGAAAGRCENIVRYAVKNGADVNNRYSTLGGPIVGIGRGEGGTALIHVVYPMWRTTHNNQENIIKYLVENGADVNIKDDGGNTALMGLVSSLSYNRGDEIHIPILKYLIKNGADVNIKDDHGRSALSNAVMLDNSKVKNAMKAVECLVESGADVNVKSDYGDSILLLAIRQLLTGHYKNEKLVKYLIKNGANVNDVIAKRTWIGSRSVPAGTTALMLFAAEGNESMVKYLVENGADIYATDENGKSVLQYSNTDSIKDYLINRGAKNSLRELFIIK